MHAHHHHHHLISRSSPPPLLLNPHAHHHRHFAPFPATPTPRSAFPRHLHLRSRSTRLPAALAEPPEPAVAEPVGDGSAGGGPVELPPWASTPTIFATDDSPTPLQLSTSVLLTGAISVFLFRSLRRRARRAKDLRVRSTGVKDTKNLKDEALESLKALSSASLDPQASPTPVQAFLGGLAAGAVAIILYKFTTTIEASLNQQAISDNFSARQITITVRTIINGICYLATFVFGINSVGLLLYSGQLAMSSFMETDTSTSTPGKASDVLLDAVTTTVSQTKDSEPKGTDDQKSSDEI